MREEIVVPDGVGEYGVYKLEVYQDEDWNSNSRDCDNLGKIITWHRRYDFTDKVVKDRFKSLTESPEIFENNAKKYGYVYNPLYMYEHSGISFSLSNDKYPFNDRWDSGQVGYIFSTPDEIKEYFNVKKITDSVKKKVYDEFKREIEELNKDEEGDSFYYILYKNNEQIDSLHGIRNDYITEDGFWEDLAENNKISEEDIIELRKSFKWAR